MHTVTVSTDVAITVTVNHLTVKSFEHEFARLLHHSLQDWRLPESWQRQTVTTAVAITETVMVTVPVTNCFEHEFARQLYHSLQDWH